jgi:hypothetical protein
MNEETFVKLRDTVVGLCRDWPREQRRATFGVAGRIFRNNGVEIFHPGGSVQRKVITILRHKHFGECESFVQNYQQKINAEEWKEVLKIVDQIEAVALAEILKDG